MSSLNELIGTRRSIRKFTEEPVSDKDLREIIEAGIRAPSGCNSQCWHFVAVRQKEKLDQLAKEVEADIRDFYKNEDRTEAFLTAKIRNNTFFKDAPLVLFIFLTKIDYYDKDVLQKFEENGLGYEGLMEAVGRPDLLSIGACVQNMLLTIHEKGLGACWMNSPVLYKERLCKALDVPEGQKLISILPVGHPAYTPREKALKPLSEVLTLID